MNRKSLSLSLCACLILFATLAVAQPTPDSAAKSSDAVAAGKTADTTARPTPIPMPEVAAQAEAMSAILRDIEAGLATDDVTRDIAAELAVFMRDIDARAAEQTKIMAQRPALELLRALERGWQRLDDRLAGWMDDLTERSAALEQTVTRLSEAEQNWTATLAEARAEAPREVVQRIEGLLAELKRMRTAVEKQRVETLRLQNRVTVQSARVGEALAAVKARRDETLKRVFKKDSPPIWNAALLARAGASVARDAMHSLSAQLATLQIYAAHETGRFALHFAFFVLLSIVLWWLRRQAYEHARSDPAMQRAALIFGMPVTTALLLAAYSSLWIYPQAPRLLWVVVGVAALVPTILILRRLIHQTLLPVLYTIVAFYLFDQIRAVIASLEALPRLLFVAEMVGGALFLLWFLQSLRSPTAISDAKLRGKLARLAAWGALAFCMATGVANALGYVTLSNLLGNAVLSSAYYGVILSALVVIAEGLIAFALTVRPLALLGTVRQNSALLRRRVGLAVRAGALALWGLFLLDRLAIRDRVIEAGASILTAEFRLGSIAISIGDVLAFGITVWAAFLVSRFVQFLLEEDFYPRAHLRRGLPYAISRTLHYAILVAGFLLAVAALGFDMTKFTILAGAFTVGVGFGLQNIFNNFVSGLILLFERPVQVGDMIQMDDVAGIVDRIGIRASVVRTRSGAEIIVPNGKLISDRVTNWTLSNHRRSVEIPVAVSHGANPKRVIELMNAAAAAHPKVSSSPLPQTLLTRMGPDWLGFELHAWIEDVEDWTEIRSEVALAISDVLATAKIALK